MISLCVKKREFVVGTHLKPENCSKSIEFFLCVGITYGKVGIAYEQNPIIMTSSNFGLKIATKTQNCRRKLKLVSNGAESQADSENI